VLSLAGIKNPLYYYPNLFSDTTDTLKANIKVVVYKKVDEFAPDYLKLVEGTSYDIYGSN
jgi:hypothetical protein